MGEKTFSSRPAAREPAFFAKRAEGAIWVSSTRASRTQWRVPRLNLSSWGVRAKWFATLVAASIFLGWCLRSLNGVRCPSDGLTDAVANPYPSGRSCPWLPGDPPRRVHFFFDQAMLRSWQGVRVVLQRPTLRGAAFDPRGGGEQAPSPEVRSLEKHLSYATVIQDGSSVRMYFRCNEHFDRDPQRHPIFSDFEVARKPQLKTCLLESRDGGETFIRSYVGQHTDRGWNQSAEQSQRQKTHVVFDDGENAAGENFTPFLDHNPACPFSERYKAIGGTDSVLSCDSGVYVYASPDGRRWRKLYDQPWVTRKHVDYNAYDGSYFDSQNVAWWDEGCRCYRLMARANTDKDLRSFGMLRSKDLQSATQQAVSHIRFKDHPEACQQRNVPGRREQFYTPNPFRIQAAPNLLLSMPMRCDTDTKECDAVLLYSFDDGATWGRMAGDFSSYIRGQVPPGLPYEFGNGFGYVHTVVGTVTGPQGEHTFYTLDGYGTDEQRFLRWTTPRHRFAMVRAEKEGWFVSQPMEATDGDVLTVNHHTVGSLSLELQDPTTSQPIWPFTHANFQSTKGDAIGHIARWKGTEGVGSPSQRGVSKGQSHEGVAMLPAIFAVHAVLRDGSIFSLEVRHVGSEPEAATYA